MTGSLVRGLGELGLSVKLNPLSPKSGFQSVGVLSGLSTLASVMNVSTAPTLRIVAGPNLVVLPTEGAEVLTRSEIRSIVVPSEWVRSMWSRDLPEIGPKISVWAAGVDYDYWSPTLEPKGSDRGEMEVLVYLKDISAPVVSILAMLEELGLVFRVVEYGGYRPNQFLSQLRRSDFVIYLGGSESQGLALHEAWATDVPTFVYKPPEQRVQVPDGRVLFLTGEQFSAAPYLTPERGSFWSTVEELEMLLGRFKPENYAARQSSIDEFSQRSSAMRYLRLFE